MFKLEIIIINVVHEIIQKKFPRYSHKKIIFWTEDYVKKKNACFWMKSNGKLCIIYIYSMIYYNKCPVDTVTFIT